MTISTVSWYLCVLFAVALAVSSLMTVAPDGQAWMRLEMATWLTLSVLFALVAIVFKRFHVPQPKWLLRLFQGFAVLPIMMILLIADSDVSSKIIHLKSKIVIVLTAIYAGQRHRGRGTRYRSYKSSLSETIGIDARRTETGERPISRPIEVKAGHRSGST